MKAYKLLVPVVLVAAALPASPALAEFGLPQLATLSPREQADGVSTAALAAGGRYLVFAGAVDGSAGVLRRDLRTGVVEPVAAGDAYSAPPIADASAPSVSADGRYVAFTTRAALDPASDHNAVSDVYVRDMELAAPADGAACAAYGPCAYNLASAVDGGPAGLTYAAGSAGSTAAAGRALSADGRRVAFVAGAESDLAGAATPAGQVAVRDLDTLRTTLVSTAWDATGRRATADPVPGGAVAGGGATLSADGTTVAWNGAHVDAQAQTVAGDPARTTFPYNEPLWRRIADGPSAPTRRIAGAADPEAPGCSPGGTFADLACRGPYRLSEPDTDKGLQGGWLTVPADAAVPALSADGRTVALVGGLPENLLITATTTDLFLADMHAGLARRDAVRRLTRDVAGRPVVDVAISPDGRRLAFATDRTTFSLSPPSLISSPPPAVGNATELWLADLDGNTLQRLSRTVDGAPAGGVAASPPNPAPGFATFDASGRTIAWVSAAANLVAVDANAATDAFLVRDIAVPPGVRGRVDISPPPAAPSVPRAWRLALRAVAQRDGTVRLDATAPGTGVLRATVQATVPVTRRVKVKLRGGGHRTVTRRVLARRQVAVGSLVVRGAGPSRLTVRVSKAYRSLVKAKAGLGARATVTFAAAGRATLRDALDVRFRVVAAKQKTTKKRSVR